VTTDKCYKNREWLWGYRENDELGGHDPYSNSKACAELVTQAFRDSFFPPKELKSHGVAIATGRAGNVIGGGDWTSDQLIPDIVRAFGAREPVLIRQPKSVRPWQHVLDCLSGYVRLAERLSPDRPELCGGWNFGPDFADTRPVGWLVDFFAKAWGGNAAWKIDESTHPHEANMLRLDSSKATELLGWRPKLRLSDALTWTAEWYKSQFAGNDARTLCVEQIDRYTRLSV
jgi:CDP-glucose 4,6-dehydratase